MQGQMLFEEVDAFVVVLVEDVHGPRGVPPIADAVELLHLASVKRGKGIAG